MPTTQTAAVDHKPLLVDRFKTKMCRNYQVHGACPYEVRCMFAHGDDELRTKQMNIADNLTTEESIKNFQRVRQALKARDELMAAVLPAFEMHHEAAFLESAAAPASPTSYRHDPYRMWMPFYVAAPADEEVYAFPLPRSAQRWRNIATTPYVPAAPRMQKRAPAEIKPPAPRSRVLVP